MLLGTCLGSRHYSASLASAHCPPSWSQELVSMAALHLEWAAGARCSEHGEAWLQSLPPPVCLATSLLSGCVLGVGWLHQAAVGSWGFPPPPLLSSPSGGMEGLLFSHGSARDANCGQDKMGVSWVTGSPCRPLQLVTWPQSRLPQESHLGMWHLAEACLHGPCPIHGGWDTGVLRCNRGSQPAPVYPGSPDTMRVFPEPKTG